MSTRVVFLRGHTVEHPATILESSTGGGPLVKIADIPASVTHYVAGQIVSFRRKADAKDFVRAMQGAAEVTP